MGEFAGVLNLSSLPPEDAIVRKISVRRAWVCAKASMLETPKQREGRREAKSDCSDTDDECDPSTRRGMLGIFRQRHRFSIGMHNQPSDKSFAKINKFRAKRLFT